MYPRFVSSLASIFAGGLACGIHLTNSSEAVAFIASHAPTDILVLEDAELLRQVGVNFTNVLQAAFLYERL